MIPYFEFHTVTLGPLVLQVWGFFVAMGILIGLFVSARRAEKVGLARVHVYDAGVWIILAAFFGARVVHVLFYGFSYYAEFPLEIVKVWNGGYSVIGGFLGAVIAGVLYYRRHNLDLLRYADATIFGLPLGLGIGRIGCFLIHDHPGVKSDSFLAVNFPDGAAFDHGFLLSINGFVLAFVFAFLARRKMPVGMFLAVFGVWYGVVRFVLDFYRIIDTTYLGLTPAQYGSMVFFFVGVYYAVRLLKQNGEHVKIQ